ncbi:MAG TPA: acyltransferase [Ramlibacter sp.]|nr:acyltransferase [Ramlibacter sp.]
MTTLRAPFAAAYAQALARPVVHKGELLSVQRLRGLAVILVLIVHVEDVARHLAGWAGVQSAYTLRLGYSAADLFFVISGFIMAYITFARPFDARSWAISRFIRIYPMYVLFSGLVAALWLYDPRMTMGTGEQTWSRVLASLAGLPQADLPLLFVGWTVEHEIVFYSLVFFTALWLGRERLVPVMLALSALAIARWVLQLTTGIEVWDWHLASPYLIQFTLGVLVYRYWPSLVRLGWIWPLAFCAVFLVLGMLFAQSGTVLDVPMSRVVLFGLAYAGLLLAVLNHERQARDAGYEAQRRDAMVWMGDASYSIYLSHPFVLGAFGKLFPLVGTSALSQWGAIAAAALTTLAVGLLTHVLLERQVMELGRYLSHRARAKREEPST